MPFAVKVLIAYDQGMKGRTYDEFEGRTQVELPHLQQQQRLEISKGTVAEKLKIAQEKEEEKERL